MILFGDPVGTRTQGPYIKSVLLYQLSYEINRMFSRTGRKDMYILFFAKSFTSFFRETLASLYSTGYTSM